MKRIWVLFFAGAALGELIGRYQKTMMPVFPVVIIVLSVVLYVARKYIRCVIRNACSEVYPEAYPKEHVQNTLRVCLSRIFGLRLLIMAFSFCFVMGNCRMLSERLLYGEYGTDNHYKADDHHKADCAAGSLQDYELEGDEKSGTDHRPISIRDILWRSITKTAELDELSQEKSCSWSCRVESITPRSEGYLVRSGQLNLYCDESAENLKIGNTVDFAGQISRISSPRNPGEWDYAASSLASGITHRMYVKEMTVADASVSWLGQKMYELRTFLLGRISAAFPGEGAQDDAAFLRAALLGDKSLMSDEMYEMYKSNGIAHLLAISGLHVSIIGLSLYKAVHKAVMKLYQELYVKRHPLEDVLCIAAEESFVLPDIVAGAVSVIFLICYSTLTGASVSTVRAAFMMILMFFASVNGRTYDLLSAAAMSGLCIILYRPYQLFNCSFLLSFGAVAAIGGPASYIIKKYDIKSNVLSSIIVSLCIQLVTLPIASAYFFEISTYGIFLNLLVIPLMTYVVWSGMAAILVPAAGGGAHYLLAFFKWLCSLTEHLPGRSILLGRPAVLLTALLTAVTPLKKSDQITFLDVGQGDGIFMHVKGEDILVDAGSSSSKSMGKYTLEPFLKSSRVSRLDRVFVTHADTDHISGVKYLLTEGDIEIERIYLPVQAQEDEAYDEIKGEAEAAGTQIIYLLQGDEVEIAGCRITCLWPTAEVSTEDMNNESLVLLLEDGGFKAYLAGDAGIRAEAEIMRRYGDEKNEKIKDGYMEDTPYMNTIGTVDVLKCGHHGSSSSTSEELLEVLKPCWAVLSYKEGNTYGHPHQEVRDRLKECGAVQLHTAQSGAITFMLPGKRVVVRKFLDAGSQRLMF